jgi:hypothetical protein
MKGLSIQVLIALMLLSASQVIAQVPVRRQTADRDADLIHALVSEQRFDDASSVCRLKLSQHQKTSDQYALAITRIAKIDIAKQIAAGAFDVAAVASANQSIDQLLSEYPDHQRKLFLEAAKISVRQMAVQMDVAAAAIDNTKESESFPVTARLTRLTRDTDSLIDRVGQSIPTDDTRLKDQQRLEQELLVAAVSMALMQTELFAPASPDAIAAATAAIQAAEQAQLKLPPDTQAASEIQRMRITAVLRSGDAELALAELRPLLDRPKQSYSLNLQALQIEILLALGQIKDAGRLLRAYDDLSSNQSVSSLPMDLARLRHFLANDQADAAANWIAKMDQRYGAYARRVAEAIVLSTLAPSQLETSAASTSVVLIETRGRELIRDGKLGEGGRLLARAADLQTDPKRAFEIGMTAAAALQKAGLFKAGSLTISALAQKHPGFHQAPSLDLQAIVMLTLGSLPARENEIESRLRQHLNTWPESDVSTSARQWLIQLLVGRNSLTDAAIVATSFTPSQINASSVNVMISHWEAAFDGADDDGLPAEIAKEASDAIGKFNSHSLVVAAHRQLAARYFDRSSLHLIPGKEAVDPDDEPAWVEQVLAFRRDGNLDPELRRLNQHVDDVRRRLIKDGRHNPGIRRRIADLVASWSSEAIQPIDQAIIQLWSGNVDDAIEIIELNLKTGDQKELLVAAATVMGDSGNKIAIDAAISWWDQLAAGSASGSPTWHRGKMASIDLLYRSGRKDEAVKRAGFILLTVANLTSAQKTTYQSYQP